MWPKRNLGAVGCALASLIEAQDLGFFPLSSGYLASFLEFSVEGWMWRGEHKEAIKKCQVMMNKSILCTPRRSETMGENWRRQLLLQHQEVLAKDTAKCK